MVNSENPPLSGTERTRHRRLRRLGRADRQSLHAVLRDGLVAHLGVVIDDWPMVVPTGYGFDDDTLYLHGSVASQSLNTSEAVCVTITLADGLVLARSVFEHTVNYRSAMVYGQPKVVTDPAEKLAGLRCITEHMAPGQWEYARQPSRKELAATRLLALSLKEASVKVRTGPPDDGHSPDTALGLWAGELPLATTWQQPIPDPALSPGIPIPAHISSLAGTRPGHRGPSTSCRPDGYHNQSHVPEEIMANSAAGEASDYNTKIINEFRANQGRVGGPWAGTRLILIHHIGARSGIERITPVACSAQGQDRYAIWAANGGSPNHPAWYYNLKAHPEITVEVGAEVFTALAQELDEGAHAELWPKLVAEFPGQLDAAQAKTTREFPLFLLTRQD